MNRTYLSICSVVGFHNLLLVCLCTSYAFQHGGKTTLGSHMVVAVTNIKQKDRVKKCWQFSIKLEQKSVYFPFEWTFIWTESSKLPQFYILELILRLSYVAYLTFLPKANKIVWYFRDDVAALVSDRAGAKLRLGIEHMLTHLLQFGVVTMKEQVPSELFRTFHRAETTISPETAPLPWPQETKSDGFSKTILFKYKFYLHSVVYIS